MKPEVPSRVWLGILAFCVLLGAGLRFVSLEHKVYWHDEAHTALRASGVIGADLIRNAFSGKIVSPAELQSYQRLNPTRGWNTTWVSISHHPEHGPLYYLLARVAMGWVDDPRLATRGLAAVFGVLLLPAMWWCCRELFGETRQAWLATALVAVSPLFLLYAQEAREYSAWAFAIVLANGTLWRALHNGGRAWLIYAVTVLFALYIHLMTALVLFVHGLYLAWRERRQLRPWGMKAVGVLLLMLPWLEQFRAHYETVHNYIAWQRSGLPLGTLAAAWGSHFDHLLFDLPGDWTAPLSWLLLGVAFWFLLVRRDRPAEAFLLLLTLASTMVVILPDILDGSRRSIMLRYFFPAYVAMLPALAAWFVMALESGRTKLIQWILAIVLLGGLASQVNILAADTWRTKYSSAVNPAIARVINASPRPLVIVANDFQTNFGDVLSLSWLVKAQTEFMLLPYGSTVPKVPAGFDSLFVLGLTPEWSKEWAGLYALEKAESSGRLWRLSKP